MKDDYPHEYSKENRSISTGGAIVFAVIVFLSYGAWTKIRTDNCLQNAYEGLAKLKNESDFMRCQDFFQNIDNLCFYDQIQF